MDRPPVFQPADPVDFADAMAQARADGRWLLVDATAAWCQPCQRMDRTTWRDAAVVAWIEDHALAVQFDVDAQEGLARELEIRAMPTVIAFHDGVEQDRISGFRNPAGLLVWLDGLRRGDTALDQLRRSVTDPEHDMEGRLNLAEALLQAGRRDEATDELAWLWDNIARVDPDMEGVRVSFMASDIAELVREHGPARRRFADIRRRTADLADAGGPTAARPRLDWMVLNEILGDEEATVGWFDATKDDPGYAALLDAAAHHLIPLLRARDRLPDIGRLYKDPIARLRRDHQGSLPPPDLGAEIPEGVAPDLLDQVRRNLAQTFREDAALLLASLRAAGRTADAAAVEREALRLDGSDEMRTALRTALGKFV